MISVIPQRLPQLAVAVFLIWKTRESIRGMDMADISNLLAGQRGEYWVQVIFAEIGESIPISATLPYKMVIVSSGAISVKRTDLDDEEVYSAAPFQGTGMVEIPAGVSHEICALSPSTRLTVICPESPDARNEPREMYLRAS